MSRKTRKNLNLAVIGAAGRMGVEIVTLALSSGHWNVVAQMDRQQQWTLPPEQVDVVIEFSSPEGLKQALGWCMKHHKPLVSGTTGLQAKDQKRLQAASRKIPLLHSANMSLGVAVINAMLPHFAALQDWDFQVDEIHHKHKKDSPSGTALILDKALSQALGRTLPKPNSIRGGGVPGLHQVWAMGPDEVVLVQHTALNRKVFAQGALKAARWLFDKGQPGLYDLTDLFESYRS